ncbi:Putative ribonuclease H protein At1g65750 [Linum grandiflorum]
MGDQCAIFILGLRLSRSWGGSSCSFWFDYWVGNVRLCEAFPRIVAAPQSKDSFVSDLRFVDDRVNWSVPLLTSLRGGALVEFELLQARLEALPVDLITAGPTSIIWPLERSQRFSVRSLRAASMAVKFPGVVNFPSVTIWSACAPSKVQCFCWLVFFKKIATIDNLQRRGMQLVNRCCLCGGDLETVDHLLLHCSFSSAVWARISSTLSLHGPGSSDCSGFIVAWKGMNCIHRFAVTKKVILHAYFWGLWGERNNRIFRDESRTSLQVFYRIMLNIGKWLAAAGLFSVEQHQVWTNFVFNPD